jgi:hypothetical protein
MGDTHSTTSESSAESVLEFTYYTEPDEFGVFRAFLAPPANDPDAEKELEDVSDAPAFVVGAQNTTHWANGLGAHLGASDSMYYAPFASPTVFHVMDWYYESNGVLSQARLDSLVHDVILSPGFNPKDLDGFRASAEMQKLDNSKMKGPFSQKNGWYESTVSIPLSLEGHCHLEQDAPKLPVPGVHHRKLVEVIHAAFTSTAAESWTYVPHGMFWKPNPDAEPERIISEIYHSDAWICEHRKIQNEPVELDISTGKPIEKAIAALLIYSDSTRLANFGTASLWPIYMYFGNQSKYERSIPSKFAAHHLAYLPDVSQ